MSLALPVSALGVGGALVAADFLRVGCFAGDGLLGTLLVVSIPLAAAGLGFAFRRPRIRATLPEQIALAMVTCFVGTFFGACIGLACSGERGFFPGGRDGLALGAVFAFAFFVVASAVRRTGRARPSSIIDGSDRLFVAAAVAALLGVAAGVSHVHRMAHPLCEMAPTTGPIIAVASTLTLAIVVVLQAVRLARTSSHIANARQVFADALAPGVPRIDFGVGDELGAEYAAIRSAYRDKPAAVTITQGSPSFASDALAGALAMEAAMLVACVVSCLVMAAR
jgi:hypothetical protein